MKSFKNPVTPAKLLITGGALSLGFILYWYNLVPAEQHEGLGDLAATIFPLVIMLFFGIFAAAMTADESRKKKKEEKIRVATLPKNEQIKIKAQKTKEQKELIKFIVVVLILWFLYSVAMNIAKKTA